MLDVTPVLLRIWSHLPDFAKSIYLRLTAPTVTVGVAAVILDEEGRLLLLRHTYKPQFPWGIPGGYLAKGESLEEALRREIQEETGFQSEVGPLLSASLYGGSQLDLAYACRIAGGQFRPSHEVSAYRFWPIDELPPLLPNHRRLLELAGILGRPADGG